MFNGLFGGFLTTIDDLLIFFVRYIFYWFHDDERCFREVWNCDDDNER